MGSMQRIAGLKGYHSLPAALPEERPRFPRRQNELSMLRMLRRGQDPDFAADQHFPRIIHDHVPAGVIGPLGPIDALNVAWLVERKDVIDHQ